MKDRDFLIWLHERLHEVYGEDKGCDYMSKLRSIINATNPDTVTPNMSAHIITENVS